MEINMNVEEILSNLDPSKAIDIAVMMVETKLANTKSEARRLIKQKAVKINDCVITDEFAFIIMVKSFAVIIEEKGTKINITNLK
jgi:tyrosyl-tRNA synthetase